MYFFFFARKCLMRGNKLLYANIQQDRNLFAAGGYIALYIPQIYCNMGLLPARQGLFCQWPPGTQVTGFIA